MFIQYFNRIMMTVFFFGRSLGNLSLSTHENICSFLDQNGRRASQNFGRVDAHFPPLGVANVCQVHGGIWQVLRARKRASWGRVVAQMSKGYFQKSLITHLKQTLYSSRVQNRNRFQLLNIPAFFKRHFLQFYFEEPTKNSEEKFDEKSLFRRCNSLACC